MNCYNGEKYLKESLNSIINQTYKNWELIFFDNISTDGSKRILEQFKDQRIKYYKSEKFVNLYDARNLAIKKCSGNFVSFLDTDDSWFSDKLEKQIELYKKDPSCSLIYSNCNIYDEEKKTEKIFVKNKLPQGKITQELLNDYRVGLLTILVKRDVFKNNLVRRADLFKPDFVLISAGFDSKKNDPLGCFNLTDNGFKSLTKIIMSKYFISLLSIKSGISNKTFFLFLF